jgi:hypothetical protein
MTRLLKLHHLTRPLKLHLWLEFPAESLEEMVQTFETATLF